MLCDKKVINSQLIRMQNLEDGAFEELYRYTEKLIYSFILSYTGDYNIAEDIKQDTYIAINRNICSYKPNINPLAWMIQISKNIAINSLKKNSCTNHITTPADSNVSPLDIAEQNSILDYLLKSIDMESRQIVVMHLIGGYKHKEIACLLKLPITTIHWKYQAALKKLKNIYEKECLI